MLKMTCKCGAIYEVIETQGPSRDESGFKCVVCNKELVSWTGSNVSQFHLIKTPEPDRE
jgi:transposase-like protein